MRTIDQVIGLLVHSVGFDVRASLLIIPPRKLIFFLTAPDKKCIIFLKTELRTYSQQFPRGHMINGEKITVFFV